MTRPKPKKPRPATLSYVCVKAMDHDGKFIAIEGCYIDTPRDVERLIKFLEKAKEWIE